MKTNVSILCVIIALCSCSKDEISEPLGFTTPELTSDGWEISTPGEQNIDEVKLNEVDKLLKEATDYNYIYTLTIVRNDKLVFDEFYYTEDDDFKKGDLTYLQSVSKSFASMFVGIAIDKGLIEGVNSSAKSLLPNLSDLSWEGGKEQITLEHILTMSAGFSGSDGGGTSAGKDSLRANAFSRQMFSKDLINTPGERFDYRTALTNSLRDVLAQSIGDYNTDIKPFCEQNFFTPMQIENHNWIYDNDRGQIHLGGGLMLAPRDVTKIGQLVLNKGKWKGNQIVSEEWITKATTRHFQLNDALNGFGYNFWHRDFQHNGNTVSAIISAGAFGQYIVMLPSLNTVIGITSWLPDNVNIYLPIELIEKHILEAIQE